MAYAEDVSVLNEGQAEPMSALWLEQGRLRYRADLPRPHAAAGMARVRVLMAGVCATDLELMRGYYPFQGILGHEFVGRIEQAPDAPERIGQRVVGEINVSCGVCVDCRAGRANHCGARRVLGIRHHDGAFAEYACLPLANLHAVPESLANAAAVFTEPLAAALRINQQCPLRPDESVLIVGAGRLGQLLAQVLRLSGCALSVVARYPRQRQLLQALDVAVLEQAQVPPRAFDRVIEASGSADGFTLASKAVRCGGILALKSTYRGMAEVDLSALAVNEITLLGSRCGPFAPALSLLQQGLVDPLPLIDARYPLAEGLMALRRAAARGAMKVLLEIGD